MSEIRVVLIEAYELTRYGIQAALTQHSDIAIVGEAGSGQEGLLLLQDLQPDVVILDLELPDVSGIEVIRQIKAAWAETELAAPRVLVFTRQDNENPVMSAFAAGADSYCVKDRTHYRNLIEALQVTYQGNSWLDPVIARVVLTHYQTRQPAGAREAIAASYTSTAIAAEPEADEALIAMNSLTRRELEILELIVEGYKNEDISQKLYITLDTVKTHVRNILNKLGANDRTQAAVLGLRSGLVH
jgi:DNA-binding NarL/FixJ family response regulator